MQKFCDAKYCFYNTPRNVNEVDLSKLEQIVCPLCMSAHYCSKRCRDLDWSHTHKTQCATLLEQQKKNNPGQRSSSVNDTVDSISTLKSIRRRPEEFEYIQNGKFADLGKGSYGQVKLVRDKTNNNQYAMKIMHKKQIFEYCSVENLKREIKIQRKLQYPYIIKLHHYFEDKENVYLILEFAENGSLFSYLRKRRKLPEQEAFVYFFQTCLGIDYLHKNNTIHRDLKPENILLDKDGNIKICDFGWSAETANQHQKRTTFCGTCEYMAPEMLQNQPHDASLDIWCLGILLYELLHGHAPFRGGSEHEICKAILQFKPFTFDSSLSVQVKDLINSILKFKATDRITMQQIFEHPWMIQNSKQYKIDIPKYIYKPVKSVPNLNSVQKDPGILHVISEEQEVRRIETDRYQTYQPQNINPVKKTPQQQPAYYSDTSTMASQQQPNSQRNHIQEQNHTARQNDKFNNERVSRISNRNDIILREQRAQVARTNQQQDSTFMDRVFMAFGCIKRDKVPGQL